MSLRSRILSRIARLAGDGPQTQAGTTAPAEPQTAGLVTRQREIAGHPARGLTPAKLHRILEEAERGDLVAQSELAQDMEERNGHLAAELDKRRRAVIQLDWTVEPPRNPSDAERADAEYLDELLRDVPEWEDVLYDLTDAYLHGFAALEIEWARQGREYRPARLTHRPQTWFRLDAETRTELRLRDDSAAGAALWPLGWLVHRHRARSGYLHRIGLVRSLCWPYLFQSYGVGDLAELLEIYGIPVRIGHYPASATPEQKATLLRALSGIGHNAAAALPEGMTVDFEAHAQGSADPYQALIGWCERTISKILIGGTLTSDSGSGTNTNALGRVHETALWDLVTSDCRQLAGGIQTGLLGPLLMLNRGHRDTTRLPRLVFDLSEPEDMKMYSEALPPLAALGLRIPRAWAHERLGIPEPDGNEPVLQPPPAPPAAVPAVPPAPAPLAALSARLPATVPDTPERITARLRDDAQAGMDRLLATLGEPPAEIATLSAYRDWLDAQLGGGTLPAPEFAAAMQRALVLGHLAGRVDVQSEVGVSGD